MTSEDRPTNASISTMWALKNFSDLHNFFDAAKQIGFTKIELNHQINSEMLAHINWDHIEFSSVHEPCPADIPTRELANRDWLISSPDNDSRKIGVEGVKRSIRLAAEIGAGTVVVHCGMVPTDSDHEARLRNLFKNDKTQSDEFLEIRSQIIQERKGQIGPHLKAVKKSLDELLTYAFQHKIKLGLENRYHYLDIPSLDEMDELLTQAGAEQLGFIYDVGHAQAMDKLGFYPHEEWLKRYSKRMLGCHLHDVVGITDHFAPGLGEIDFNIVANYLPDHAFRTLEILPGNTLAQVKSGINLLVNTGCIRYL